MSFQASGRQAGRGAGSSFATEDALWALGSLCALHRRSFSQAQVVREFPGPFDDAWLIRAARALGFRIKPVGKLNVGQLGKLPLPLLVETASADEVSAAGRKLGLITAVSQSDDGLQVIFFAGGSTEPQTLSWPNVQVLISGAVWLLVPEVDAPRDVDATANSSANQRFSFAWFIPELLRHKKVWHEVLLASLALQLVTLATPLFTQTIIDKVVVHRTQSTLVALGLAMGIFTLFGALLSWGRQYLLLHTGNRVDAVLGATVWAHLLKLSPRYFEHRPTGVVAARLHAIETIREFISGAAISLVLDLPFLMICLSVMLWYSLTLSAICVGILTVIALASAFMAPLFQHQLNHQFLLGARNQAFITEHLAGFETVKTLQMEPQLRQRYSGYLASLLASAFQTRQVANTYNTVANTLQQIMALAVLLLGAYTVMNEPSFTVGMLVAFQMFAGKLSEPVLRIVGLWTQFQQASLSVQRLGDVMNAPVEPYSLSVARQNDGPGHISILGLAFSYSADRPLLYRDLHLDIAPGQAIAIMGESGSGKSTLAKLLLGFYQPDAGSIRIDGIDTRSLSANELRAYFGVVPQETILFSGSILANLQLGNPGASFLQVTHAARLAGIHSVIEQLPQGYQTEIGERGVGLSGGQKQRLAIARALLKQPRILIFDEATSALDGPTAEAFATTINPLRGKVTMIFITHALPRSLHVDRVLYLGAQGLREIGQPNAKKT